MSERIISFGVTNKEYQDLIGNAQKTGMNISQYCKSKILENDDFSKYYTSLLEKVQELPISNNYKFILRDLWKAEEWNSIPNSVKLAIGKHFYKNVKNQSISNITIEGLGPGKIMRYSKSIIINDK
jgi:hypothetical protein